MEMMTKRNMKLMTSRMVDNDDNNNNNNNRDDDSVEDEIVRLI